MHRATHANRAHDLRILSGLSALVILLAGCEPLTPEEKDPGGCQSHAECSDSLPCTSDRCGSDGSCTNLVSGDWCLIQGQCVAGKAVKPGNACEVCTPLISARAWSAVPDGTSCDDAVGSTFNDTCGAGACAGTTYSCDDKLACTQDICTGLTPLETKGCQHAIKAGTCLIAGACHASGAKKDGTSSCARCDPAVSKVAWSASACCGDGKRGPGEQCDISDLGSMTCAKLGFSSGSLSCASDCSLDTDLCVGGGGSACGNGALDYGEPCDNSKLGGMTCVKLGYASGTLSCAPTCTYNVANCVKPATCGNGALDAGESCDGSKLGSKTCTSQGFTGGTLKCLANCALDYTLCSQCGNKVLEAGEQCDGPVTGATCITRGFNAGVLACAPGACSYDTSGCGWALGLGDKQDAISAVALDGAGNVYVAGNFNNKVTLGGTTLSGASDSLFVARLDPSGAVVWSTVGTGGLSVRALTVASAGVYLTGSTTGGSGSVKLGGKTLTATSGTDLLVARFVAGSGTLSWAKIVDVNDSAGNSIEGTGIAVASSGVVHVTGSFRGALRWPGGGGSSGGSWTGIGTKGKHDLFVYQLGTAGQLLRAMGYGSTENDDGASIALDSAGNVYVTGSFGAAITYTGKQLNLGRHEGGSDLMVMRMDPTLTPVWAASAGGSKADAGTGIAHVGGTLYVTGTIGSGVLLNTQLHNDPYLQPGPVVAGKGGSDVLVARLSTSGLFSWGVAAGGSSDELAGALAMGPGGKLHIAGTLRSTAVFGGTSLNSTAGELFVARLVPGFGFDWAENFDGSTGDAMAVNSLGQIYVTGSFSAPAAFGATTLNKGHTYVLKVARP